MERENVEHCAPRNLRQVQSVKSRKKQGEQQEQDGSDSWELSWADSTGRIVGTSQPVRARYLAGQRSKPLDR